MPDSNPGPTETSHGCMVVIFILLALWLYWYNNGGGQ